MRFRTFMQQLRDLAAGQRSPVLPDREPNRSHTKSGPGRMPYNRTAGKRRFPSAHGPGSIDHHDWSVQ